MNYEIVLFNEDLEEIKTYRSEFVPNQGDMIVLSEKESYLVQQRIIPVSVRRIEFIVYKTMRS